MIREKYKCGTCGALATWNYMPGYEGKTDEDSYLCENCVSRGCSCNNYSVRKEDWDNGIVPAGDIDFCDAKPEEKDKPFKWLDDHTWTHVDDKEREYPCCEYTYEKEGFDVYTDEEIVQINLLIDESIKLQLRLQIELKQQLSNESVILEIKEKISILDEKRKQIKEKGIENG